MKDGDGDGNGNGDGGCNEINLELSLALPGFSKFLENHHEDPPPLRLKHHHEDPPPPPLEPQQQEITSSSSFLQPNKSVSSRKRQRRCAVGATAAALQQAPRRRRRRQATSSLAPPSARPPLNINQPVCPPPPFSALPAIDLNRQPIRPPLIEVRPPFSWAREHPTGVGVRSYKWLIENGITHIHGEVRCRNCGVRKVISYELESKLSDTKQQLMSSRLQWHCLDDRALLEWKKAVLPPCDSCGRSKCVGPVIPAETKDINWLFMLLGQTLGTLNMTQLKEFCQCTNKHSTGAKNRLFFDVYKELCRQLFPELVEESRTSSSSNVELNSTGSSLLN